MKPGDQVEVQIVWAHRGRVALRRWFRGYEFLHRDDKGVTVKDKRGRVSTYAARDVRLLPEPEQSR